ncbi:E1 [Capra hircus papillomavirus 1]|uniref:Replication protein E1 n=1 Tax=Capra hircus papillomavirus 1 TaxID=338903 RepID=Q1I125_9PAPI|nr:E1 [Capra hircus papillomavirus 1]AAZ39803.1 E1 [Capra hircus papillomavirus 1]
MEGKKPKGISFTSPFIIEEAECSDCDSDAENVQETETETDISFIDNTVLEEGNTAQLFAQHQALDAAQEISAVKRKLPLTTERCPLGSLDSSLNKKGKLDDSGYAEADTAEVDEVDAGVSNSIEWVNASSEKGAKLAIFKQTYGVTFASLTRVFKSDKTCCHNWVVCVFSASEEVIEGSKIQLRQYCDFYYASVLLCKKGHCVLYLLDFKASKNRETVIRLFTSMLAVPDHCILSDPPKLKHVPAALFWLKTSNQPHVAVHGQLPNWICQQTMLNYENQQPQFELRKMVQWALDHNLTDDSMIAYNYAQLAEEDENANAWLNSNSQARYLKECALMTRHFLRAQRLEMTMAKWLTRCITSVRGNGDWKAIIKFLKYQNVNIVNFLSMFRDFMNSKPKKNCLVICGAPNTGKSIFAMSLMQFLQGKTISFANHKSHFWLQPLADCKFAVLDDATLPCWSYLDIYCRNALDGNYVCIDSKHKNPVQIKIPPLLITTNYNILQEDKFFYLHSRLLFLEFNNAFPLDEEGNPQFDLNDQNWKSFFIKLRRQLDLEDIEEEEENDSLGSTV